MLQFKSKKDIRWKDGRRFARRVHVHSSSYIGTVFCTHAEAALVLCQQGSAQPLGTPKEKEIVGILLLLVPGEDKRRRGTPDFSTTSYKGQNYVFKERLGAKEEFAGLFCYSFSGQKLESLPQ